MGSTVSNLFRPSPSVANTRSVHRSNLSKQWIGGRSSRPLLAAKVLSGENVFPPGMGSNPSSKTKLPVELKLGPLDGFCLRLWYLEGTFFYKERLDAAAIKRTLAGLLTLYPSFAGRARKPEASMFGMNSKHTLWSGYSVISDDSGGVPLVLVEMPGTATAAANSVELRQQRGLANVPDLGYFQTKYLFAEDTPLMTLTVVHFTDGGSALGLGISHGLVDWCGFTMVLKALSFAHLNGWDHPEMPILQCKRPLCLLAEMPASNRANDSTHEPSLAGTSDITISIPKPPPKEELHICDVRSVQGLAKHLLSFEPHFWNSAGQPRARLFFSWDELKTIKEMTPCIVNGENVTPSSSVALAGRLWIAFSEIILPTPQSQNRHVQPYVMAQMRAPRIQAVAPNFLGNCMEAIRANNVVQDPNNLGEMCGGFHAANSKLLDDKVLKEVSDTMMDETVVNFGLGLAWKCALNVDAFGPNSITHDCGLNAMQSFRVMAVDFGAGETIGYIPANVGSRLSIDNAPGGVEVYLQVPPWAAPTAPADWLARTEAESFRSRVLNIGGGNVSYSGAPTNKSHDRPLGRESIMRRQSFQMFSHNLNTPGYKT
jgi:hypothetical protein